MINNNITVTPKKIDTMTPNYLWSKAQAYFRLNNIRREQIAAVLGVTSATVSSYNKDASKVTLESMYKICRTYHIDGLSALEKL